MAAHPPLYPPCPCSHHRCVCRSHLIALILCIFVCFGEHLHTFDEDLTEAGWELQVAMQMGGAVPFGAPPGPNFFNLPPGGAPGQLYPSMDPSQAGTRAQRDGGADAGPASKRPRGPEGGPGPYMPPGGPGFYGPPGGGAGFGGGGPMPPPWAGGAGPGGFGGLRPPPGWQPGGPPPAGMPMAAGGPSGPPESGSG